MISTAQELEGLFMLHADQTATKFAVFPWANADAYGAWLAQTYYFVRHTTRLLARVAGRLGTDYDSGHRHAVAHLRAESGHDVLALKGLKAIGRALSDFPEFPETSLFYQSQYYWIDNVTPNALQGYALFLEMLAARDAPGLADRVERHHGKSAATFLRVHAADDVAHVAEGLKHLTGIPPQELAAVRRNLTQSAWLYGTILDRIIRDAAVRPVRDATTRVA